MKLKIMKQKIIAAFTYKSSDPFKASDIIVVSDHGKFYKHVIQKSKNKNADESIWVELWFPELPEIEEI